MTDPSRGAGAATPPKDPYLEALHRRTERTFGRAPDMEKLWNQRRAIVGPSNWPADQRWALAQEGREALLAGTAPTPDQLAALEVAIRLLRPSQLSKKGALDDLPPEAQPVFPEWDAFRAAMTPLIYSVGRVDDPAQGPQGTCWVVGEDVVLTNRHVLDVLSRGTRTLAPDYGWVDFRQEYGVLGVDKVPLAGVYAVSPTADLALLKLKPGSTASRPPLPLADDVAKEGDDVAAIGYPLNDPVRNPLFITTLFNNRFGVKRGAPGEVMGMFDNEIGHDCTTLGGNSGSPLVALATGRVVGVHASGFFSYRNGAIPLEAIAGFLREAGVQ
jgi:S1-C subfamily serine protease